MGIILKDGLSFMIQVEAQYSRTVFQVSSRQLLYGSLGLPKWYVRELFAQIINMKLVDYDEKQVLLCPHTC